MSFARTISALFCGAITACAACNASAQTYPTKSIRLISPFPPSGGVDAVARIIAQALGDQLGQQVLVDNRGGAGGRIGMELVAKSPPDGYTLILGNVGPFAILPASGIKLPFDPRKDFQPVSLIATSDYILTVHPSLPARSVKDVIALARSKPGMMTYASSGNVTGPHLAGELLKLFGKVDIVHVPYKGNGPAALAMLTGEATMMFGRGSVMPHIDAGKLRGIATTGVKRTIPKLPTINESLPGFEVTQWYGILAPAGTPGEIVARLQKEVAVAVAKPKVAQSYRNLSIEPVGSTPEQFATLIASETATYAKVIKTAKITTE
ncbi:MAG TPA: tripartite tricarboxylate transporter substrate binding protein [Burkholderiales bacterium]|nr:tripartite tricarboxylate transporter substrate binding protein [Burkholderiales bacterium]